ncbi:MAG: Kelch repeat-containing protein [Solirubrobacteraceae bacterium]
MTWSAVAALHVARSGLAVAPAPAPAPNAGARLYAVGGVDGNGNLVGQVETYDPSLNTWTISAQLPTPRVNLDRPADRPRSDADCPAVQLPVPAAARHDDQPDDRRVETGSWSEVAAVVRGRAPGARTSGQTASSRPRARAGPETDGADRRRHADDSKAAPEFSSAHNGWPMRAPAGRVAGGIERTPSAPTPGRHRHTSVAGAAGCHGLTRVAVPTVNEWARTRRAAAAAPVHCEADNPACVKHRKVVARWRAARAGPERLRAAHLRSALA